MSNADPGPLAGYNSLTDTNLSGFFRNSHMQHHLRKMGLITKRGEVVSEQMFRLKTAKAEHRKHVRELLAQAIVHKTLDMERSRQMHIRQKLEAMAKKELVAKIRQGHGHKGDEDVLPYLSPRPNTGGHRGVKSATSPPGGQHRNVTEGTRSDRAKTAHSKTDAADQTADEEATAAKSRRKLQMRKHQKPGSVMYIDANGLPVLKKYEVESLDSQYMSGLSPQALRHFTLSLNNVDYMSGISPYVLPQPETLPVGPQKPETSTGPTTPRHGFSQRSGRDAKKLHPPHEPVNFPVKTRTDVEVTLQYHGNHITIDKEARERGQEIDVVQQHCGGNTCSVFKGIIRPGMEINFISKRHPEFPFSLTLYIDGRVDSRISTCCEYKHKPGVKLGGKLSRFSLKSVSGGEMCFKCKVDRGVGVKKKKIKKKTPPQSVPSEQRKAAAAEEDDYEDEEFDEESETPDDARQEQERKEKEQREERERKEKERQERERKEQEQREKEKKEQLEREKKEKEQIEREKKEKEQRQKEELERERRENEKREMEQMEKEKLEKEKREKERLEKEEREREEREKEQLRRDEQKKERTRSGSASSSSSSSSSSRSNSEDEQGGYGRKRHHRKKVSPAPPPVLPTNTTSITTTSPSPPPQRQQQSPAPGAGRRNADDEDTSSVASSDAERRTRQTEAF